MIEDKFVEVEAPWQPTNIKSWQFTQIKHHYKITLGKMLQNSAQSLEDMEVPYLKAQHIQWDNVLTEQLPTMWASPWEIEMLQVRKGDLLVCEGGEAGRAVIVSNEPPINCIIQNALHLVRSTQTGDVHFLRYLLLHTASHEWLDVICNKATIAHFTVEKFSQMWIWLPPLSEQRAIANYLDHETAKIDTLISDKERLLDLLTEKRRALITDAVTHGLNPTIPLWNSGFEWLGKIPQHWNVKRIKFLIFGIDTGFSPQCYNFPAQEREWGVLKTGCVNGGIFNPQENKTLPPEIEPPLELEVKKDDILMSRASGSTDLIGSVGLVQNQPSERLLLSDKIFRLKLNTEICDAKFFVITMGSFIVRQQILQFVSGAEGLANNIAQSDIRELLFPVPLMEEQIKIVSFVEEKTSKIDKLSHAAVMTIDYLHERRAALITAAVTGQIKVTA
ncbi:MAG: restriction endonuclease subunit S [Nostoc sp. NOS(2021)]|uniref:restriction endonuclease subunit S n=1 Tax=Nostoc sp. NOS(2021) TaxID=2815407 RepID=UPI0025F3ABA3|nr:restriction endonuclease subunit S [Nostoc sp. NOS(2021)]MBN3897301.1 restriction endonuclease subunit S [Nostoc sp. NOS(2021)]